MIHRSIADIPEGELVDKLMADPFWRDLRFLSIKGFPERPLIFTNVLLDDAPQNPRGDIDLLLLPSYQPDLATAIQVKRIKVDADAFPNKTPNKLHEFKKGVQQTNILVKMGFFQAYLFVLVVVDSRKQNAGKRSFAGLTKEQKSAIEKTILPDNLSTQAGLVYFEFVQSMDDPPLGTGTFRMNIIRLAQQTVQPPGLTEWVKAIYNKHHKKQRHSRH